MGYGAGGPLNYEVSSIPAAIVMMAPANCHGRIWDSLRFVSAWVAVDHSLHLANCKIPFSGVQIPTTNLIQCGIRRPPADCFPLAGHNATPLWPCLLSFHTMCAGLAQYWRQPDLAHDEERYDGMDQLVTRKGAIRAGSGDYGIIPGSMGTGSYIVRGLGNPAAFNSASHGAGRRMSRNAAKKRVKG